MQRKLFYSMIALLAASTVQAQSLPVNQAEILRMDRDDVLLRTRLEAGDRVVVSPIQVVVDGMQVRPIIDGKAGRS